LLEDLLALGAQLNGQYRDLPPVIAAADLDAQCSTQDLVAKADANNSNAILFQKLFGELDQF
jgi:hypothetical protein